MLNKKALTMVENINLWIQSLPPETVHLVTREIPLDDDYNLDIIVGLEPTNPKACPIEIGVTTPETGADVYINLDTWTAIANRIEGIIFSGSVDYIALYVEPCSLSVQEIIAICQAVAQGNIHLEVGIHQKRIVSTSGYVKLSTEHFKMHGINILPIPVKLGKFFKYVDILDIKYDPYVNF